MVTLAKTYALTDITIETELAADYTTTATVKYRPDGYDIFAKGYAKLKPGDKFDEVVGIDLAVGRALEKLGRKVAADALRHSETLAQYKSRMKVENRIYSSGLLFEAMIRHMDQKAVRQARMPLDGQEIAFGTLDTTTAKTDKKAKKNKSAHL